MQVPRLRSRDRLGDAKERREGRLGSRKATEGRKRPGHIRHITHTPNTAPTGCYRSSHAGGDGDADTLQSRYVLEAKPAGPARGLHRRREEETEKKETPRFLA